MTRETKGTGIVPVPGSSTRPPTRAGERGLCPHCGGELYARRLLTTDRLVWVHDFGPRTLHRAGDCVKRWGTPTVAIVIECGVIWPSRFSGQEHRCHLPQNHEGPHECSCGAQREA
jgi:hypothetical protein